MFLIKLKTFIKSLFWHISSGLPKSTQKEIDYRWNICLNCDAGFDAVNSQCIICGCNLSNKRVFLNKLAWADQECPLKKWNKTLK
jgi:hypothetical protein